MFDNIKRWCVVNGNKKNKPALAQPKTITKTPDDERVDKTPSLGAKHVSFDITMTQAKKSFMIQMSKLHHQAQEDEHFEIDTPGHKESDVPPLPSTFRERDVDAAFDSCAQEASVGQGQNGVTPHIQATPHTTKSANMRPHDQHHNCRRDPTSWNLDDKPKDKTLLVLLSFAVDEHCECDKHAQFCVCPTEGVVENAHTEAAGIEISRGLLWDHRSADARAVLGFMEGHWSIALELNSRMLQSSALQVRRTNIHVFMVHRMCPHHSATGTSQASQQIWDCAF